MFCMQIFRQITRSLHLIDRREKIIYIVNLIFTAILSVLDLLGITFFLLLLSTSTGGTTSNIASRIPALSNIINHLSSFSADHLSAMLGITIVLFTSKSIFGLFVNYINTRILNSETQRITGKLIDVIFRSKFNKFEKYSSHDHSYALNEGVRLAVLDTLYPASILFSDIFLTFVITINLLFVARVIFIPTFLFFILLFYFLNSVIKKLTRDSFRIAHETDLKSKLLIQETLYVRREISAYGVSDYYLNRIESNRNIATSAYTRIAFSNMLPKYVYEVGLFLGIALIAICTLLFDSSSSILLNVTLFVLSSSRIVPALLRIQYYLTLISKATSQTSIIFDLLSSSEMPSSHLLMPPKSDAERVRTEFIPEIIFSDVSFSYPRNFSKDILSNVSLKIRKGEFVSIIGKSGSGKSTLLDLMLGNLEPNKGEVMISGVSSQEISVIFPHSIAYVPQKVTILTGNIYENVALGLAEDQIDLERVKMALMQVQLYQFFCEIVDGFEKELGEFGSELSGGQLQRIGIARAIYADSEIFVFDESMSALDAQSESIILDFLKLHKRRKTIVMVTHRLTALQSVDRILYVENGSIVFQGTFDDAILSVPDFAEQVRLQSFENWKNESAN